MPVKAYTNSIQMAATPPPMNITIFLHQEEGQRPSIIMRPSLIFQGPNEFLLRTKRIQNIAEEEGRSRSSQPGGTLFRPRLDDWTNFHQQQELGGGDGAGEPQVQEKDEQLEQQEGWEPPEKKQHAGLQQ